MKKYAIVLLSLFIITALPAQTPFTNTYELSRLHYFSFPHMQHNKPAYGKTTIADWYTPIRYAQADSVIGNSLQYAVGFMMHDSLAKIVYADSTTGTNQWLSFGRVLDPKDTIISTINPAQQISRYVGYTLDSIRFTYLYVRNVDSMTVNTVQQPVVDTLFIYYFTGTEIARYTTIPSLNKIALVNWVGDSIRMPRYYMTTDTILLTRNDSTGVSNRNGAYENYFNLKKLTHKVPSGIFVNANGGANTENLIAYTTVFKSAVPTVLGSDTAIMIYQRNPSTLPAGSHRTNYFGFYYALNADTVPWSNPVYYNTTLLSPAWAAYQPNLAWYGYVAGNMYTHEYFVDADFYLTTTPNAGVNMLSRNPFAIGNLYPNPAKAGQEVYLELNVGISSEVIVKLYNLVGENIQTPLHNRFDAGQHTVRMDLSGLARGVYFVNVTVNNSTRTQKLILTD
jgi:hypothetical protein